MEHWTEDKIANLYQLPLFDLIDQARATHQQHFDKNEIELCTLLSIKTGACPEDCAYCPQSAHYNTGLEKEKLFDVDKIIEQAKAAKNKGSQRFCMGAAWRSLPKKELPKIEAIIKAVKELGMETCMALGMVDQEQADALKTAGLDYYNHNLDTSPKYYEKIIKTRHYQERIDTLNHVANAGIHVCCGGIIGMGEAREDRIQLLLELLKLPTAPTSIPINRLIPIKGTPLEHTQQIDHFEFIKTIAITRILFPKAMVRLAAGRETMSQEMQSWCFMAGANSIFYGEKLLTAPNNEANEDIALLKSLGLNAKHKTTEDALC